MNVTFKDLVGRLLTEDVEQIDEAKMQKNINDNVYEAVKHLEVALEQAKKLKNGKKFIKEVAPLEGKLTDTLMRLETGGYYN